MSEAITPQENQPARKSGRLRPLFVATAGGDDAQQAALKNALGQIKQLEINFVEEDAQGRSGAASVILMLILDRDNPDGWRRELRRRNPDQRFESVIALLDDDSPIALRAALRAGADDVLEMPPDPDRAYHTLLRVSELSSRRDGAREKIVCSLVSVSGGVGVSHLSVSLALAMNRLFERRTVLMEMDLQAAPFAVLLNQDPEHSFSELADPTSTIDSIRLESVLCKHESGLYWLAAPNRIEEAELISAATVEATLKVLRELFDVVVIDCGTHLAESSIVAWERSDHLLYVLDQTVTSIRAAQRFLALYQRLGIAEVKPSFILNRYNPASPITQERIERALAQPIYVRLAREDKAFAEQQITGADLWKIRSGSVVREQLEGLARKLYGAGAEEPAQTRSLLGRLLHGLSPARGKNNGID